MTPHWIPQGVEWSETWKEAAVLIPRFNRGSSDSLILTRRSDKVAHHKKQISFPGGAYEPEDTDLWQTALREAQEEIGLAPENAALVKQLSTQFTPTGFRVTPYIADIIVPKNWIGDPNEIDLIFEVPIAHLQNPKNYEFMTKEYAGHTYLDPHFYFEEHDIWGLTGRVICEFLKINPSE